MPHPDQHVTGPDVPTDRDALAAAWDRVVADCGCPDVYYCPTVGDVECPRHSGFDVCCARPGAHEPVPADLRPGSPGPATGESPGV